MNNANALATTQPTTLAMARRARQQLVPDPKKLDNLELSPQVHSAVLAKIQGTPLHKATDEQFELMWSQVSWMLGITVKDIDAHIRELLVLTDWLIDGYAGKLTSEEVIRAYKMATTGQLEIDQLFSLLVPKHIGTVLNGYLRYLQKDPELNRIFSQQLLLPDAEQSADAIDTFMEECISSAAVEVAGGQFYYDHGNGMYAWLVRKGRIVITIEDVDNYRALAAEKISPPIGSEHARHAPVARPIGSVLKLVEQPLPQDYESRLKACAMRLYLNDWLKSYHEESEKQ